MFGLPFLVLHPARNPVIKLPDASVLPISSSEKRIESLGFAKEESKVESQ